LLFFTNKYIVISTEVAHAFVSCGVEKSASLPQPSPNQHRVLALAVAVAFLLSSFREAGGSAFVF
jgi:hypothetical protein